MKQSPGTRGAVGFQPIPIEERFWVRVEKTSTCWLWKGYVNRQGYGRVQFRDGLHAAHRVAWTLTFGEIPTGLCVLHRCDVPGCVRPDHLFLGTNDDNVADRKQKGRSRGPRGDRNGSRIHPESRPRGEANAHAKLTTAAVIAIRLRWQAGEFQRHLAKEFGITQGAVSAIVRRKNWQHVS